MGDHSAPPAFAGPLSSAPAGGGSAILTALYSYKPGMTAYDRFPGCEGVVMEQTIFAAYEVELVSLAAHQHTPIGF
jgi:hypothetical protein